MTILYSYSLDRLYPMCFVGWSISCLQCSNLWLRACEYGGVAPVLCTDDDHFCITYVGEVIGSKYTFNMIIGCYPRSECMKYRIKAYNYKWWLYTPDGIKLSHTLDSAKVNVSSQIFCLRLFYKFIVEHKIIHLQHGHQINLGKWYELKFFTIDT